VLTVLVEVDVVVVVVAGTAEPLSSEHGDGELLLLYGVHPWQGPPGV
jgi:hypothetical protein